MADTTLIEELEHAAKRVDQLCDEMHGHSTAKVCDEPWFECQLKPLAARLRARVEYVRKMLASHGRSDRCCDGDNVCQEVLAQLTGPIPLSDETGGER